MKVIQVNCVYEEGSTGKITADIHRYLEQAGIESKVLYGRGNALPEENVIRLCGNLYGKINNAASRVTGLMYGGCRFSTDRAIAIIERERPDIVHLQCINGYFLNIYRLITWLKERKIPTILTLHAEFMYTANCGHALACERWKTGCGNCPRYRQETKSLFFDRTAVSWWRMRSAFDRFDSLIVVSVSPWLMERAKQSPILADKAHRLVLNGLDTDVFRIYDTGGLKKKHGVKDEKIIFHASPSFNLNPNHIKGGYYVAELAKKLQKEHVKIFVAGSYPEGIQVPGNVVLLGRITDQGVLAQYYSMADVTLLTSTKETFSMVTAESLSCGTPVVGFEAGAPEMIAIEEYSRFVGYGNLSALEEGIKDILSTPLSKENISQKAHAKYGKDIMCKGYTRVYKELSGNSI